MEGRGTSLLFFPSLRASVSSSCASEYISGKARHVSGCSEV